MSNKQGILWIIGLFFLAGVNNSFAGERILRGKITDRNGTPVTEAVIYIEAYREGKGAFDFGYAVVNDISQGTFSLTLKWKRNAMIAYAVFAPGRNTIAGFDRTHYYKTHDLDFELDSIAPGKQDCESRLVGMSFPFERAPSLADRLRQANCRQLLHAFICAYAPIIDGTCPAPSGYDGKIRAVKELKRSADR